MNTAQRSGNQAAGTVHEGLHRGHREHRGPQRTKRRNRGKKNVLFAVVVGKTRRVFFFETEDLGRKTRICGVTRINTKADSEEQYCGLFV
jgi:hypothetical protein